MSEEAMDTDSPVALITGGARRIGAAIAQRLHQQGYRILLHYRNSQTEAQQLVDSLNQQRPQSAALLQADLLVSSERSGLIDQALQHWQRLDLLVNNASSFYPAKVSSVTEAQWDDLLGSNLKAPFFLAQGFAAELTKQQGAIINIIDIHAQRPLQGYPVYSVAKAGLAMLTQALAKELAPAIRVNGVAPGPILLAEGDETTSSETLLAKTPLARLGDPSDIAEAVCFLAGQSYITGQILAVDGGKSVYS